MLHENYDTFLFELSKLFQTAQTKGNSVYLTMKKYDGRKTRNPRKPNDKPKPTSKVPICTGDLNPSEHKCLIRARLGNKKISVVISPKDMNKFQVSYSNLLRGNMQGLKKKQK